jgi:hypothetical protein
MSTERDLGALICLLNPYTDGSEGSMDPHVFITATNGSTPAPASTPTPTPGPVSSAPDMTGVWMEIQSSYPADWEFKGQPHKINTAVRIAYRWPKTVSGVTVWVTDFLLVGFEGSGGGE